MSTTINARTRIVIENDCPNCEGKGEFEVKADIAYSTSYVGGGPLLDDDGNLMPLAKNRAEIRHTPMENGKQGVPCTICLGSGVRREAVTFDQITDAILLTMTSRLTLRPMKDWF